MLQRCTKVQRATTWRMPSAICLRLVQKNTCPKVHGHPSARDEHQTGPALMAQAPSGARCPEWQTIYCSGVLEKGQPLPECSARVEHCLQTFHRKKMDNQRPLTCIQVYTLAMTSISTLAPRGRALTAKQLLAGKGAEKNSAYISLTDAKSLMSVR